MATDSAPTSAPAPAPSPDPASTPDPTSTPDPQPVALTPGWKTSEAWLTLLTMVIGAIPSSGLTANSPLLAKIVGLAIVALSGVHYTAQRTALKRAHIAALSSGAPAPTASKLPVAVTGVALLIAAAVVALLSSCGGATNCQDPKNAQSAVCVVEGVLVDCTGISSLSTAVVVAEPIVDKLLTSAKQADGSFNFAPIESQLVDLALQYGPCVLAEIWTRYMSGTPAGSGMATRAVVANKADFAAAFDRIRARVAPGRKFKTAGGTI